MSDFTSHEASIQEFAALPVMLTGKIIGRDTALAELYAGIKTGQPVLIHGAPGVGKTALAATLAAAYLQQSGSVLWMAVNAPQLEELLVRVGRAYKIEAVTQNSNPISMIGAIENTLKLRKPLVVFDGEISPDTLSRFIDRCAGGVPVVATATQKLDGAWEAVAVDPLDADSAAALFKRESRMTTNDHDIDVFGIVKLVGYLPLGVIIAARAMLVSKQSPDAYIKVLRQIATASDGNSPIVALTASFRALTGPLQGLILMMGALFNGQASPELLSLLSGAPEESVRQAMTLLSQLHLVERITRYGEPYYQMHPITLEFTQTWLKNSNRLAALQEKARDSVVAYAQKYAEAPPDQYPRLAAEMDTFIATARWAEARGDRTVAGDLVTALTGGAFVPDTGYLYEQLMLRAISTGETFPAPVAPEEMWFDHLDDDDITDKDDEEESERAPGESWFDHLDDDEDEESAPEELLFRHLDDAIEDETFIDDEEDESEQAPGESWFDHLDDEDITDKDDEEKSERASEKMWFDHPADDEDEDDEETLRGDDDALDEMFIDILVDEESAELKADAHAAVDLSTKDLAKLRGALAQSKHDGDSFRQIDVLKAIGKTQIEQGMENEAIANYSELLSLYESLDDSNGILETLDMLSALMVKTQNASAALLHASRGVNLADELDDAETKMHLLTTLADSRQQLGESDAAEKEYRVALEIARTRDDTQNEAIVLYKLGFAQLDNGETHAAIDTWEQALQLFKDQHKRDYEGRTLSGLGSAYSDLTRWAEAVKFHTSALYIARETQNKEEEALQLNNLAYAALQAGQLAEAVIRYRQALHLAYTADNEDNVVSTIVDLARLLSRSKSYLAIAELLIDDALNYDPNDKDVKQLKARIANERLLAESLNMTMKPVHGTAQDYAANAYKLLDG